MAFNCDRRQLREVPLETRPQHSALGARGCGACKDDEIPGGQVVALTKRFASKTLDAISVHGAFRGAARDGQAEPSVRTAARTSKNAEEPIARTSGLGEDSPELGRSMQSLIGRETCRAGAQRRAK
jgi:hypothetical protein